MFRILSLIAIFCLSGCCMQRKECPPPNYFCHRSLSPKELNDLNYASLVDIIFGWGVELRQTKGIILCGSAACFDKKLNKICMEFRSQDIFELQDARRLLVYVVEGLLKRVNENIAARSSMGPGKIFTPDDLNIIIHFESFYVLFDDQNYTGRLDMREGGVQYSTGALYDGRIEEWGCKREAYNLSRQLVAIEDRIKLPYYDPNAINPQGTFKERYVGNTLPPTIPLPPPAPRY